jgi:hypothetical protein
VCGPANDNDEKRKAALEKFSEGFEAAFLETLRKHCSLLRPGDHSPIFDNDESTISVSAPTKSERNGRKKNRRAIPWIQ